MKSSVILCCVKFKKSSENQMTEANLKETFSKCGKVKAVKIFENTPLLLKTFVEFFDEKVSMRAVFEFADLHIGPACFRAYPSKKKTIEMSVPVKQNKLKLPNPGRQLIPNSHPSLKTPTLIRKSKKPAEFQSEATPIESKKNSDWDYDIFVAEEKNYLKTIFKITTENQAIVTQIQQPENVLLFFSNRTRRVLGQRNFFRIVRRNFQNISVRQFLPLFGYYGDIHQISMLFKLSCIYVEYSFLENLTVIMNLLQGLVFFGERLQISIYTTSNQDDPIIQNLNSADVIWSSNNLQEWANAVFQPIFFNAFPSRFLQLRGYPKDFNEYLFQLMMSEIHQPICVCKVISHNNISPPSMIA